MADMSSKTDFQCVPSALDVYNDKLTQLRQWNSTVDEYHMEMEMLMQRAQIRESPEMTMQRFIHGLKFGLRGTVRSQKYDTMNEMLHHAREAESQLAEEAKVRSKYSRFSAKEVKTVFPVQDRKSTRLNSSHAQ